MAELRLALLTVLGQLDLRSLADILIIAFIIYWVLLLLRGTTAMAVVRGIVALLLLGWVLSSVFQLTMLGWLLRSSLPAMLIILPILFQPELRRVLERIGSGLRSFAGNKAADGMIEAAEQIVRACQTMSERRYGALIVLERDTGLQDIADTGIPVDALPTAELLVGMFFPNSPLHDGALIVRRGRVVAARCTLPLSETARLPQLRMGMRHRAALGIAERTDAVAVVVSEETGRVSVAANGRLITPLEEHSLRSVLLGLLQSRAPARPAAVVFPERRGIVPGPAVTAAEAEAEAETAVESATVERGAR